VQTVSLQERIGKFVVIIVVRKTREGTSVTDENCIKINYPEMQNEHYSLVSMLIQLPVMTEDGWNLWANGCGAMGIQVSSGEFNFTRCCDFHDVCYGICGMKMKICEDRFSQCLNNVCGAYGSEQKDSCLQTANTFKMGTKLLGCQLFQESQNSNCQCVAKDTVQQKRKEDLDNLLHKYGDSRDGSALMGEKKSTNKYAKLVADVIEAHYPDSIEIRDPRRQRGKETDEATISDSPHKATEDEL